MDRPPLQNHLTTAFRLILGLAPGLVVWLLLGALSRAVTLPHEAAELGYLGRLSGGVLAAAGLLAASRWQVAVTTAGGLLVAALGWVVPAGTPRLAAVVAASLAVLAAAAWAGLGRLPGVSGRRSEADDRDASPPTGRWPERLPAAGPLVALAVGLQLLFHARLLLAPDAVTALTATLPGVLGQLPDALGVRLVLLALPTLGALAVALLAGRRGLGPALVAGATALVLGTGWTAEAVAVLGTLGLLVVLIDLVGSDPPDRARRSRPWLPWAIAAAVALGIVALLWTRLALLAAAAGVVLWAARRPDGSPGLGRLGRQNTAVALALAAIGGTVGLAVLAPLTSPSTATARLATLLLLVPALGAALVDRPTGEGRPTALLAVAALGLGFAAALATPWPVGLVAPATLAALALGDRARPTKRSEMELAADTPASTPRPVGLSVALQGIVSSAALGLAALLAAPPWLRADPLATLAPFLELGTASEIEPARRWLAAGVAVGVVALLALVPRLLDRRPRTTPALSARAVALGALWLLVGGWLVSRVPAPGLVLVGTSPPGSGAEHPGRIEALASVDTVGAVGGRPEAGGTELLISRQLTRPFVARELVLVSSLANAVELPPGTPVATIHLRVDGAPDRTWTLRSGSDPGDTGEWAAARSDLVAAGIRAPVGWSAWVAPPEAGGAFFGQRYRSRVPLGRIRPGQRPRAGVPVTHVEVSRRPDLPPRVDLTVERLELRP